MASEARTCSAPRQIFRPHVFMRLAVRSSLVHSSASPPSSFTSFSVCRTCPKIAGMHIKEAVVLLC